MRKLPILYTIAMTGNELDAILCIAGAGRLKPVEAGCAAHGLKLAPAAG